MFNSAGRLAAAGMLVLLISGGAFAQTIALAAYNPDVLTLETSFGTAGKASIAFPGLSGLHVTGVDVDSLGYIVVAGWSTSCIAVARFTPSGFLDTGFNSSTTVPGTVQTWFPWQAVKANAVTVDSLNRIVIAGQLGTKFALFRYKADGTLDTDFGSGGYVQTSFGLSASSSSEARALDVTKDGKIVAAGTAGGNFAVARYTKGGVLDSTFGTGGIVITDLSGNFDDVYSFSALNAVAIDANGRIVAAGPYAIRDGAFGYSTGFAVMRYSSAGAPDLSFGDSGTAFKTLTTSYDSDSPVVEPDPAGAKAIAFDSGGILIAGTIAAGAGYHFSLARLDGTGHFDTSFGPGGIVLTSFGWTSSASTSLAAPADGTIVQAGAAGLPFRSVFALSKFSPHVPSPTFSTKTTNDFDCNGTSSISGIVKQKVPSAFGNSYRFIVAGNATGPACR